MTHATTTAHQACLVIVLGMLKGGTGKTTSAIFSALRFAEQGKKVVVLDGDQTSQSAYDWWRLARAAGQPLPFEVVRFPFQEDIAEEIKRLRQDYDVVIVDAGGGNSSYFEEACSQADVLLMPLAPTAAEARRIPATMMSAERAAARNVRGLTVYCVLVKADSRTSQPRRWRDQLVKDGHPLTDTNVGDLVLYSDAYGQLPTTVGAYEALLAEVDGERELTAV